MKKFLLCFLTLLMPLFSDEVIQDNFPNIKDSWDWNNDYLFLDIELDEGLEFSTTYSTITFLNGDPGAEIRCLPLPGSSYTKEGYPLKNVIITVMFSRDERNHLVDYEILEEFIYQKAGWFLNSTKSSTIRITGNFTNTDLDLSIEPEFVIKSQKKGYIRFKIKE